MNNQKSQVDETNDLPWMEANFSERQRKEIEFSLAYASDFNHGTDGHNGKVIIARLASLLTSLHFELVGRNYPDTIEPIMGYDLKKEESLD